MKNLLLLGAIAFSLNLNAQSYTWVEAKPDDNPQLFSTGEHNIIEDIKTLVRNKSIRIYKENFQGSHYSNWLRPDYNNIEQIENDLFKITIKYDFPLVNEMGEPIVDTLADGTLEYKYPDPEVYDFTLNRVYSIRIKELNIDGKKEAQAIGLVANYNDYQKIHFWIKLEDLKGKLENIEWLDALKEGNYKGFQYMQSPERSK